MSVYGSEGLCILKTEAEEESPTVTFGGHSPLSDSMMSDAGNDIIVNDVITHEMPHDSQGESGILTEIYGADLQRSADSGRDSCILSDTKIRGGMANNCQELCGEMAVSTLFGCPHLYPAHSGNMWHNYKGRFSVLMMAAVDANYKFIYISVGTQGRVSDAGLFAHSDLKKALDQGLLNVPPPEKLPGSEIVLPHMFVGDEAYPLRRDLMKHYPFRQMDHNQRVYNYRLSRAHRVVENAFGILANRFRVFRSTILLHPDSVSKITLASACLHNFICDRHSEVYMTPALADWEDVDHRVNEGAWRRDGLGAMQCVLAERSRNPTLAAKQQRDLLKDYFVSPAGQVPWQEKYI